MKKSQLNCLARGLCEYLASRNNDIAGYWGIGKLCKLARENGRRKFAFKIRPNEKILIFGYELSDSIRITEKLTQLNLDTIEGRLSFFKDGRYPDGTDKYTCGICIAATQNSRTGLFIHHISCWSHDPGKERRRMYNSSVWDYETPLSGISVAIGLKQEENLAQQKSTPNH